MGKRVSTIQSLVSEAYPFHQRHEISMILLKFPVSGFPTQFNEFCQLLEDPKVRSVEELIQFNTSNAARAMPPRKSVTATMTVSDKLYSSHRPNRSYPNARLSPAGQSVRSRYIAW